MPETNDFAERLSTLEADVAEVKHKLRTVDVARSDVGAARALSSGAYEEVR